MLIINFLHFFQAVEKGLIDATNALYVDPITKKSIPISQAIEMGLVDVNTVDTKKKDADVVDGAEEQHLDKDIVVTSVIDPRTGREISYERAVQEGIIDPKKGLFTDPTTGKTMSLLEALQCSHLRARLAQPGDSDNVIKAKILQISGGKGPQNLDEFLSAPDATDGQPLEVNAAIFNNLKSKLNPKMGGIIDQTTGKEMTINEAFESGLLELSALRIKNSDGDSFTLQEAAILGIINPHTAKTILKSIESHSLQGLIDQGIIDPEHGEYVDPKTGERMTIKDAIAQGLLDPDMIFYADGPSNTIITLGNAIDNKKFDPITGMFVDPKSGMSLSMAEAIKTDVINATVDAQKIAEQISALRFLQAFMDTTTKGIKDPRTGEDISVEEAILAGILDIPGLSFHDIVSGQSLSIPDSVDAKLMDPKTAKSLFTAMSKMSLSEALSQAQIDPNTGKFVHPDTKRKINVKDAIEAGLLDPYTVFFVDPKSNQVTNLGACIEDGRFNPVTGKFKDPLTNLEISINNAIKKGIVIPDIDPNQFIEEKMPVQELLDAGKISASKAVFESPDGENMSLKEALANGFLTPASMVKVDPKTGHVKSTDDGTDIVRALIETKKNMDWLTGVETTVGSQERPSEDSTEFDEQLSKQKVSSS